MRLPSCLHSTAGVFVLIQDHKEAEGNAVLEPKASFLHRV